MSENRYTKEEHHPDGGGGGRGVRAPPVSDIFGVLKNMAITVSQLERAFNGECSFDGVFVNQFGELARTDLFLRPDLDTFEIFPWRPQQGKVARLICDVYNSDGTPYEEDTRMALKRVVEKAERMATTLQGGAGM